MRALGEFILLLVVAILAGALVSYPLYAALSLAGPVRFEKVISQTTVFSGLFFSVLYLRVVAGLNQATLGLESPHAGMQRGFLLALLAGIGLMICVQGSMFLLGIQHLDPDRDLSVAVLTQVGIRALATGLLIALMEEILFRGALYGALEKRGGALAAILLTSAVYASGHFIKYPEPPPGEVVDWLTGIHELPQALVRFQRPVIIDSWISLFLLGTLFAVVRRRSGHILHCIGLHAGIVAALKIIKYVANYDAQSRFAFLANRYDNYQGWLPSAWLLLCITLYLVFTRQPVAEGSA